VCRTGLGLCALCERGRTACYISVPAAGANVRTLSNGNAFLALVNGVPLVVLQQSGKWLLVATDCDLKPTGVWSDTHGVPPRNLSVKSHYMEKLK
jgi:hypothetical protein